MSRKYLSHNECPSLHEADYLEKYYQDRMKMEFEIDYSNAIIDPNSAAQQISSLCYAAFENEDLIDCKAFNSINVFQNQPDSRSKRDDTVHTVIFVAAVARFKTRKSTEQQEIFTENLKNRIKQDSSVRSVYQVNML